MAFNIDDIRADFPNLAREVHGKPLVYFDNAATTFKPKSVINAMTKYYMDECANVHRGVHYLSEIATAMYENSRKRIRDFINAESDAEIIFTRGTTDSVNLVMQGYGRKFIESGDEIVISHMEHHSNIVPWQMLSEEKGCVLKVAPVNDAGELIFEEFEKLLTPKTRLVSVAYISNSLGTINPIKKIIQAAHKYNIPVLVDGAQAVGHVKVDMQDLGCDFFAFSGHKLFGPTGIGVLYGKKDLLEKMSPAQGGGDMIASVTFKKTTYNVLPYRFEAGTPNIAGAIGLGTAVDYVNSVGFKNIMKQEKELLEYGTKALKNIPGLKLIGTAKEKVPILSFVFENIHAHDLGTLVDEEGVAIRTGHHCTMPLMDRFKVPATARASLSFYNTQQEIDVLVEAIYKAKEVFHEL